jgi:hypothetical protein
MKTDEMILPTVVMGVLLMVYGLIEVALEPKPATLPVATAPTNEWIHEIWWSDDATKYQVPKVAEFQAKTRSGHQYVLIHSTNCPCKKEP